MSALAARNTSKNLTPLTTKVFRKRNARPLFEPEDDELLPQLDDGDDAQDPDLEFAIQESIELEEEASLRRALEESKASAPFPPQLVKNGESSGSGSGVRPSPDRRRSQQFHTVDDESDDEGIYTSPTRLETALSIAGAGPRRPPMSKAKGSALFSSSNSSMFGIPSLLMSQEVVLSPVKQPVQSVEDRRPASLPADSEEDEMEEVPAVAPTPSLQEDDSTPAQPAFPMLVPVSPAYPDAPGITPPIVIDSESDEEMEEIELLEAPTLMSPPSRVSTYQSSTSTPVHAATDSPPPSTTAPTELIFHEPLSSPSAASRSRLDSEPIAPSPPPPPTTTSTTQVPDSSDSEAEPGEARWSRSPSPPAAGPSTAAPRAGAEESWDAAQEIDVHAEEDEYTRFISQVKGKDIDVVRREIDDEIRELNKQRKNAMRDSEDINQQMVSQIMVRLVCCSAVSWCLVSCGADQPIYRQCSASSASPTSPHPWKPKRNAPPSSPSGSSTA